ncbi:hypothetical protein [Fodinicola feengrottensis]|uniref:hypothetical protein n=1 Tax=Fodinicola feengrottensis TaxID=435914 RepID=UPI002442ECE3|nr:hypothetical protein [Fodinicola feengrottensis]
MNRLTLRITTSANRKKTGCPDRRTTHAGDHRHHERTQQARHHQDVPPPETVDEDAGERTHERVRQQQNREPEGYFQCVRLSIRVEQHRPGETGLENPVRDLGGEPDG